MRFGRIALLGTAALYVALLVWSALVLPDRVPSHFDGAGRVDDWSSRTSNLVMWVVLGAVILAGIPLLARLVAHAGDSSINLPASYKEYWLTPARREEFTARLQDDTEFFSAVTGLLLAAGCALTTWVAVTGRDGAPWWTFAGGITAYLLFTVIWMIQLRRAYKPPVAGD